MNQVSLPYPDLRLVRDPLSYAEQEAQARVASAWAQRMHSADWSDWYGDGTMDVRDGDEA